MTLQVVEAVATVTLRTELMIGLRAVQSASTPSSPGTESAASKEHPPSPAALEVLGPQLWPPMWHSSTMSQPAGFYCTLKLGQRDPLSVGASHSAAVMTLPRTISVVPKFHSEGMGEFRQC